MPRIRAIQESGTTSGNSFTGILPVYEEGDLLVAWAVKQNTSGGNYTCSAGWNSQGAPYKFGVTCGIFTKTAGASESAPTFSTTASGYTLVVIMSIEGHNGVEAAAVSNIVTDTSKTLSITSTTDNALVLQFFGAASASYLAPTIPTIDPSQDYATEFFGHVYGCANSIYSRSQATAGAVAQATVWKHASYTPSIAALVIADDGSSTISHAGYDSDIHIIEHYRSTVTGDNPAGSTISNAALFTPIYGVTVANSTISTVTGSSIAGNYFDSTVQAALPASSSLKGVSATLSAAKDLSESLLVGRWNGSNPLGSAYMGSVEIKGMILAVGEGSEYKAWTVSASNSDDTVKVGANIFIVDPTTDGFTASATLPDLTAINKIQFCGLGIGLYNAHFGTLYSVGKIVAAGGTATRPIRFADFSDRVLNGFLSPLMESAGQSGTVYVPVQIGGDDPVHLLFDGFALQFPESNQTNEMAVRCHVAPGRLGVSFDASAGDTITMRNGVITSATPFHFNFLSTTSSSATYDFTGLTLVNSIITLRDVTTFSGMTFADCVIMHNDATVQGGSFNGSTIVTNDPSTINNSQFIGSDTVYSSVEYRVDIGAGSTPAGNWVRVDGTTEVSMIDWDGNSTGAKVTVTGGTFTTSGVNQTSGDFPSEVISDGKQTNTTITTAFTGLPPGMLFDVIIMSSCIGTGRHGKHTVTTSEYETFALKDGADNTTPFELTALVGSNGQLIITTIVDPAYPSDVNIPINAIILRGKQAAYPALKIITPGTYVLTDLDYIGYGANGSASAAIHNNSGGEVILNIAGGSTPTILNGIGATTTVQSGATVVVEGLVTGSRVIATLISNGSVLHNGIESSGSVTFSVSESGAIKVEARKASDAPYYKPWTTQLTPISGQTNTVTALQELDQ